MLNCQCLVAMLSALHMLAFVVCFRLRSNGTASENSMFPLRQGQNEIYKHFFGASFALFSHWISLLFLSCVRYHVYIVRFLSFYFWNFWNFVSVGNERSDQTVTINTLRQDKSFIISKSVASYHASIQPSIHSSNHFSKRSFDFFSSFLCKNRLLCSYPTHAVSAWYLLFPQN